MRFSVSRRSYSSRAIRQASRWQAIGTLAVMMTLGRVGVAHAAVDLYLSVYDSDNNLVNGGASGPNVPAGLSGSIPLQSFLLSFTRAYTPGAVSGGTLGPVDFSPVSFTGSPGPQSSTLADGYANGTRFESMTITIGKNAGGATDQVFAKWDFRLLTIDAYQPGTAGQDGSEAYDIDYAAVKYTFYSYASSGTVQGTYTQSWNRLQNAPNFNPSAAMTSGFVPDLQFITGAVPEPGTLGLAASFGLLLARRRSAGPRGGH